MGHVHSRDAATWNDKAQTFAAAQAIAFGACFHHFGDFGLRGHSRLVDVFDDDHLRAEDAGVFWFAARQSSRPRQRRVTAGVDEAVGLDSDVAVAGGEVQRLQAPPVHVHLAQDGADQRDDTGLDDGLLDDAAECDLVVVDDGGNGTATVVDAGVFFFERIENVVGDAMSELVAVRAVRKEPAKSADDRVDGLAA